MTGMICLLGPAATPVDGHYYEPGTETWFLSPNPTNPVPCDDPAGLFMLRLIAHDDTKSPSWRAAMGQAEAAGAKIGTAQVHPDWRAGDERVKLPSNTVVYTLDSVTPVSNGKPPPRKQLSLVPNCLLLPGAPPTWYRESATTPAMFGDIDPSTSKPGATAVFRPASPTTPNSGFPTKDWLAYGPTPEAIYRGAGRSVLRG